MPWMAPKKCRKKAEAHMTFSMREAEYGRSTEELENSKTGIA